MTVTRHRSFNASHQSASRSATSTSQPNQVANKSLIDPHALLLPHGDGLLRCAQSNAAYMPRSGEECHIPSASSPSSPVPQTQIPPLLDKTAFPGFERLDSQRYLTLRPLSPISPIFSAASTNQLPSLLSLDEQQQQQQQAPKSKFSHSPDSRSSRREGKRRQQQQQMLQQYDLTLSSTSGSGSGGSLLFRKKRQSVGSISSSSTTTVPKTKPDRVELEVHLPVTIEGVDDDDSQTDVASRAPVPPSLSPPPPPPPSSIPVASKGHNHTVTFRQRLLSIARPEATARRQEPSLHVQFEEAQEEKIAQSVSEEERGDVRRHTALIRASWIEVNSKRLSRADCPLQTAQNGMPLLTEDEALEEKEEGKLDALVEKGSDHGRSFFASLKRTAWKIKTKRAKTPIMQQFPTPQPFPLQGQGSRVEYEDDSGPPLPPCKDNTPPRRLRRASVDVYSSPPLSRSEVKASEFDNSHADADEVLPSGLSPLRRRNKSLDMLRAAHSIDRISDAEEDAHSKPLRIVVEEPTPDNSAHGLARSVRHSRHGILRYCHQDSVQVLEAWEQSKYDQQYSAAKSRAAPTAAIDDDLSNSAKSIQGQKERRSTEETDVAMNRLGLRPLQLPNKYRNDLKTFYEDGVAKDRGSSHHIRRHDKETHNKEAEAPTASHSLFSSVSPSLPRCQSDEIKRSPVPSPRQKKASSLGTNATGSCSLHMQGISSPQAATITRKKRRNLSDESWMSSESSSSNISDDSSSSSKSTTHSEDARVCLRRSGPLLQLPEKGCISSSGSGQQADQAGHTQTSIGTSILFADQALMGQYEPSDLNRQSSDALRTAAAASVNFKEGSRSKSRHLRPSTSLSPSPSSSSTESIISYESSESAYSRTTELERLSRLLGSPQQTLRSVSREDSSSSGVTAVIQSYIQNLSADESNATATEGGEERVMTPESAHSGFTFRPPHFYSNDRPSTPGREEAHNESNSARERRFSHLWTQLGFENSPCPPTRRRQPRLVVEDTGEQHVDFDGSADLGEIKEVEVEGGKMTSEQKRKAAIRMSDLDLTKLRLASPSAQQPTSPSTMASDELDRSPKPDLHTQLTVGFVSIPVPRLGEGELLRRTVAEIWRRRAQKMEESKRKPSGQVIPSSRHGFRRSSACPLPIPVDEWEDTSCSSSLSSAQSSPFFCSSQQNQNSEEDFSPLTDCSFWTVFRANSSSEEKGSVAALTSPTFNMRKSLVLYDDSEEMWSCDDLMNRRAPTPNLSRSAAAEASQHERDILRLLQESSTAFPSTIFADWSITVLLPPRTVEEVDLFLAESQLHFLSSSVKGQQPDITDRWFVDWEGRWRGEARSKTTKRSCAKKHILQTSISGSKCKGDTDIGEGDDELDESSLYLPSP